MELLRELDVGVYEQYVKGKKCIQLDQDSGVRNYSSSLPSVGVAGTLDLGQAIIRVGFSSTTHAGQIDFYTMSYFGHVFNSH